MLQASIKYCLACDMNLHQSEVVLMVELLFVVIAVLVIVEVDLFSRY